MCTKFQENHGLLFHFNQWNKTVSTVIENSLKGLTEWKLNGANKRLSILGVYAYSA